MSNLSVQLLHGKVRFRLGKSIPSADAAASIKFGLEKIPGVGTVHFVGDDIDVVFAPEGAAVGLILDALREIGFPSAVPAGMASPTQASAQEDREGITTAAPEITSVSDTDEAGAAIA